MILRLWHGRTPIEKADAYEAFLIERAIPDYRSVPGNLGVKVVRRDEGAAAHFLTITTWESLEAIAGFVKADDLLTAKYYPEDDDFLLEFEPFVEHYVVCASEPA